MADGSHGPGDRAARRLPEPGDARDGAARPAASGAGAPVPPVPPVDELNAPTQPLPLLATHARPRPRSLAARMGGSVGPMAAFEGTLPTIPFGLVVPSAPAGPASPVRHGGPATSERSASPQWPAERRGLPPAPPAAHGRSWSPGREVAPDVAPRQERRPAPDPQSWQRDRPAPDPASDPPPRYHRLDPGPGVNLPTAPRRVPPGLPPPVAPSPDRSSAAPPLAAPPPAPPWQPSARTSDGWPPDARSRPVDPWPQPVDPWSRPGAPRAEPWSQPGGSRSEPWPGARPEPAPAGPPEPFGEAADRSAEAFAETGDEAQQPAAGRRGALARLAGKASWNLIDQMLSTLTNAVLGVLVAKLVTEDAAGAFSIAFLLFGLGIAVARALVSQVLTIRYATTEEDEWPAVAARGLGTVVTIALPAGGALVVAGFALGGMLQWPLVALGATIVPLLLQDTIRGIFFAQSRAHLAALNDGVWALVQFSVMGALIAAGQATAGSLTFVWGVSAGVAVLVGLVQLRARPRLGATRGWVREHGDLLAYLLPETLITTGGANVAFLGIGKIVNLSGLGAVTFAQRVLSPLLILTSALASFAMPEVARRAQLGARDRRRIGVLLALGSSGASLLYLGAVLLVPDEVGSWILGATWSGARGVLLPMGLYSVLAALCFGPFVVIAGMGHAKRTFRITVLQTVLMVIAMPLGAVLWGTAGAAWLLVVAKAIEVPFWFQTLRTASVLGPVTKADEDDSQELQPDHR